MHRLTYTSAQSIYILIVCSSCSRFEISISMANNLDCAVKYTYKLQMTELSWNYCVIIIMFSWHDCNSMNFSRITEYLSTAYWKLSIAHSTRYNHRQTHLLCISTDALLSFISRFFFSSACLFVIISIAKAIPKSLHLNYLP